MKYRFKVFYYSKALFEYSIDNDDIYKNTKEYNPYKMWPIFIVFDNVIADMVSNKNIIHW